METKFEIPKISKELYETLSPYNMKFLQYVQNHPAGLKRSHFSAANSWDNPTEEVILQPWPIFINKPFKNRIATASTKVFSLIKSIPDRLFGFNTLKISEYYRISKEYAQICLLGVDNEYLENFLTRGDFIITSQELKCLEYNVSTNLGGWELPLWEKQMLQVPFISEFLEDAGLNILNNSVISLMFNHIIEITQKAFPKEEEINIALAIENEKALIGLKQMYSSINRIYLECLKQKAISRGKILLCRYNQLAIKNDTIFYQNDKVHTILDYYLGQIPLQLLVLFKMRKVLIYNGPMAIILSHKFNIALLSQHENSELFTPEDRETIKKYIPWTRKVEPGASTFHGEKIVMEDFVLTNRNNLVLKPGLDYGGQGVLIGKLVSKNQWDIAIKKAFQDGNWIIQEYIPTPQLLFQWGENGACLCDVAWGMLVFGNEYAGLYMRTLPPKLSNGVVNVKQGAEVPIIFEVEPKQN